MAELIVEPDLEVLAGRVAQIFFAAVTNSSHDAVVALPGGRSIIPILRKIVERSADLAPKDWKKVHFFIVDERLVPLEHAESNFRLLKVEIFDALMNRGLIDAGQCHPFQGGARDVEGELKLYSAELKKYGGKFDLAILGVGEDAHVGALFPGHWGLTRSEDFIMLGDSPKPPPQRMTSSAMLLKRSRSAVGLFLGAGKRDALGKFLDPEVAPESCPVKLLSEIEHSYAVTDLIPA